MLLKKIIYCVENDQKKVFLRKMLVWIKDDRDSMTWQENLQKEVDSD